MEFYFVRVTRENIASFLTYLLPHAAAELLDNEESVLAVGVCLENHSVGAAVLCREDDGARLLSLYVDDTARRLGVGAALLKQTLSSAGELWGKLSRIDTKYIVPCKDVAGIDAFLASQGFDVQPGEGHRVFSVNTADVREQRLWKRVFSPDFKCDEHVVPFSELLPEQIDEVEADESVPYFLKPSHGKEHIHKGISSAWVENGHVLGCIMFYMGFDDELVLAAAFKRAGAGMFTFQDMLTASINRAYYMNGRHFVLHIHTVSPKAAALVEKLTRGLFTEYAVHEAAICG